MSYNRRMRRFALILLLLPVSCGGGDGDNHVGCSGVGNMTLAEENRSLEDEARKRRSDARKLFNEAGELSVTGNNTAAVEKLEQAVELSPDDEEIHARLGHVYVELLRFEDARKSFLRAADLTQGAVRSEVQARAAWCSHKLAIGAFAKADYDAALAHVTRALEVNPGDAELHKLRGDIQFKHADYAAAAEAFQASADLAVGERRFEALSWKGQSQFHGGFYRPAIETFTKLIDERAEGYEAYGWRAYCHVQIGKKPEAESDFNQAAMRTTDRTKREEYETALKALAEAK
jgi:Flp pilus assembly protein TadD